MGSVAVEVTVWKAAPGAQFSDEQAAAYGPCIGQIAERDGKATPEAVVKAARNRRSPLHEAFEWDDSIAGEHWRKVQARNLINHLRVVVETEGGETETKAFFHVALEDDDEEDLQQAYLPVDVVAASANYRAQVVTRAKYELARWRQRYQQYRELASVIRAIDRLVGEDS